MSHHFFAVPHCYPLHKETALFVHCSKCQTYPRKFICISGCTQHALTRAPYGLDVYWGPPADLGNKVFQRANIWHQVASKWCWIRNMWWMVLDFGFVSRSSWQQILLVQIMLNSVIYLSMIPRILPAIKIPLNPNICEPLLFSSYY